MLLKTLFIQPVNILIGHTTDVHVKDDIKFSITVQPTDKEFHVYQIENIAGDFEIIKISSREDNIVLPYDIINKTFASNYHFDGYNFHILADVEFDVVNNVDDTYQGQFITVRHCLWRHLHIFCLHAVEDIVHTCKRTILAKVEDDPHHIRIPLESLTPLAPHQCFEKDIIFPEFDNLTCTCYIKKIDYEIIEVHIDNPHQIGINGKPGDLRSHLPANAPILLEVAFDPSIAVKHNE